MSSLPPTEDTRAEVRATGRGLFLSCLAIVGMAVLILLLHAPNLEPSKLHLGGNFVDQAGYILTARSWLDTGELSSALIYPAYMEDPGWRLYMPGHYAALALSYVLFGWGVFPSLLPSLVGYVLSTLGIFLIGNRLVSRSAGWLSAFLFASFSGVITYSFTVMAEMTLIGACVAALTLFCLLPACRRPYLAPFLLILPFLFRETGALYVIPFVVILFYGERTNRWKRTGTVLAASIVLLGLVNVWQISTGKGTIPLSWVTDSTFNYGDAVPPPAPELTAREWGERLLGNGRRNVTEAWRYFVNVPSMAAVSGLMAILSAVLVSLVSGLWLRGRQPLVLGAGLLGLAASLLVFFLYDVAGEKGMRGLLFTVPMLSLSLGTLLRPRLGRASMRTRTLMGVVYLMLAVGLTLGNKELTRRAGFRIQRFDLAAGVSRQLLESIGHDDDELLVAHFNVSMEYAVFHYPVRLCFVPSNDESLLRVKERFGSIGTLIVPEDFLGSRLSPAGIRRVGLKPKKRIPYSDRVMLVYQP